MKPFSRGIVTIEFIIVLPLLLLLLIATAEIGRALYQYNILAQAVRNGARYYAQCQNVYVGSSGQLNSATAAAAKSHVVYGISNGGTPVLPNFDTNNVTTSLTVAADDDYITVVATYNFNLLAGNPLNGVLGLFGGSISSPITLKYATSMRVI